MWKILVMIFTGIIVSFYYFPFEFSFLPGINTKMGLAVVGILLVAMNLIRKGEFKIPHNLFKVFLLSVVVSIIGVISVVVNNTPDYAYSTYFISMLVWLSGAYAVCALIKKVHGSLTIEKITIYLTFVCVIQCILALIIDANQALKLFVDTYIMQDQVFLTEIERIYGIGASLDTAGVRFSACLILLLYLINKHKASMGNVLIAISIIAYTIIFVIGNMVARTTIVGVGLSLIYTFITFRLDKVSSSFFRLIRVVVSILLLLIPISLFLYENNQQFYELSRFAFEGFFNLAERGEWYISSNERLKSMIVFPDNLATWLIGDGYFINPYDTDPTYVGDFIGGYYMGTDIGYLRFVFYFGLIGLIAFSYFFVSVAKECISLLPDYKLLILFILLLGFIIWLKVATDVFLVFALLICIGNMQDQTPQLGTES